VRTTLTIDDDIAVLVEQEQRRSGDSFKGTVNSLLRLGLMNSREKTATKPFVVTPFPLGIGNCDKISELLEELEGPYHR
jgi:hypothetical protein